MAERQVRAPELTFERARALRREMTLPEVLLWRALRGRGLGGLRFRRQHPMGAYILDFFSPAVSLAIEIDGASHDNFERALHDASRDAWLARRGIAVLRFTAEDILGDQDLRDTLDTIFARADPGQPSIG